MMVNILYVALGGAIGAVLRYLVKISINTPYGTLIVNLLGCFFIGLLYGLLNIILNNILGIGLTCVYLGSILGK